VSTTETFEALRDGRPVDRDDVQCFAADVAVAALAAEQQHGVYFQVEYVATTPVFSTVRAITAAACLDDAADDEDKRALTLRGMRGALIASRYIPAEALTLLHEWAGDDRARNRDIRRVAAMLDTNIASLCYTHNLAGRQIMQNCALACGDDPDKAVRTKLPVLIYNGKPLCEMTDEEVRAIPHDHGCPQGSAPPEGPTQ